MEAADICKRLLVSFSATLRCWNYDVGIVHVVLIV